MVDRGIVLVATAWVLSFAGMASAVTDAEKCEAGTKAAGKYGSCRLKAEAKAVKTGQAPEYTKCENKVAKKFGAAETKYGVECPTSGDMADIRSQAATDATFLALKLSGVRFVDHGDGTLTDTQTGLMWEKKDNLDNEGDFANPHDADNRYTWAAESGMIEPTEPLHGNS